ncbi:MAG: hypothetical protein J3Q66DRAFT_376277 [Benniella sp.]|nr:MAG: hypothetical protein J3Q66DRAFT_376277 [Benniella sp.]
MVLTVVKSSQLTSGDPALRPLTMLVNTLDDQGGNIDPMDNLGVLLIEFFELYGLCFNYTRVGLTVRDNVFAGAYGALTQAVQNRHRELFMDDKRVSSSHVQFDDRNRVAADSKQKSSGLHRSTQVSLIKEYIRYQCIIQHRQKIAKVFLDGTYQVMFGDPIVHSLDLKTV